jgi:enterochelin esterase-like enzyme
VSTVEPILTTKRTENVNEIQAVLAILEGTPVLLRSSLDAIPEPARKRRLIPGQWSAHERVIHLASIHPVFALRLERMLAEDHPRLDSWTPSHQEGEDGLLDADLHAALDRFERERGAIVTRLRGLPEEAWARTADHPDYADFSVLSMFRQLAVHDGLHLYRIEQARSRRDWPEDITPNRPVPVAEGLRGALARMIPGQVNVLGPFEVPGSKPRHLRIYLPRDYTPDRTWLALYLFDGQNLFDDEGTFSGGWHVHEAVETLTRTRRPVPVVIGIDHGDEDRILELNPFTHDGVPGRLAEFAGWVTGELMPVLSEELKLVASPLGAVIGGSSMGGLAALWTHFHFPEFFGGALVMSPSFWLDNQKIFDDIAEQPDPAVSRIYLDAGAREDRGRLIPIVAAMAAVLAGRGWDDDKLMWRPDARGGHNEASWRRRMPKALRFLYR